jgi:hypothetical protein
MLEDGGVCEGVKLKGIWIWEKTSVYFWKKRRVDRRISNEVMKTSDGRAICIRGG